MLYSVLQVYRAHSGEITTRPLLCAHDFQGMDVHQRFPLRRPLHRCFLNASASLKDLRLPGMSLLCTFAPRLPFLRPFSGRSRGADTDLLGPHTLDDPARRVFFIRPSMGFVPEVYRELYIFAADRPFVHSCLKRGDGSPRFSARAGEYLCSRLYFLPLWCHSFATPPTIVIRNSDLTVQQN